MPPDAPFDALRLDPRVRLAMRILEFEQTAVPALDDLAARVNLSAFRLAHLFAEQVGESVAAYGRRIRLDNSNHQMIHDDVPLDGVAAAFGYRSQAAYTRAYTRQFGMPPRQYVATILGQTQRDYAASMTPGGTAAALSIDDRVDLHHRLDQPALARRFYGYDVAAHWRSFLTALPPGLAEGARLAVMAYDNVRVTPARHWRFDCAVVFDTLEAVPWALAGQHGLDPVELPGGLHAEVRIDGGFAELWRVSVGLLTEWLPAHAEYKPEGDPVVSWIDGPPVDTPTSGTATMRIRPRGMRPAYNMRPLTRHGSQAGDRTDPAAI